MFLNDRRQVIGFYRWYGLFAMLVAATPVAMCDEVLLRRFTEEAEPAWEKYLAQKVSLNKFNVIRKDRHSEPDFDYEYDLSYVYLHSGDTGVVEELRRQKFSGPSPPRHIDPPTGKIAKGRNDEYAFKIMQVGDQRHWSILGVERGMEAPANNYDIGVGMSHLTLLEFGPSKGYLTPVSASPVADSGLVEIDFEFKKRTYKLPSGSDFELTELSQWRLTVDPSRYWLPVSGSYFRSDLPAPNRSVEWEYAVAADGSLYLSNLVQSWSGRGKEISGRSTIEISAEVVEVDEDRFRLSYYGLPEPSPDSSSKPLVIIAIVVGLLLLAFGIWLRRSKRTTTAAA